MLTNFQTPVTDLNRLIAAAVIDREFCTLLLTNPLRAIGEGYYGELFQLSPETQAQIGTIEASSLPEFARKLTASPGYTNSSTTHKRTVPKFRSYPTGPQYDVSV